MKIGILSSGTHVFGGGEKVLFVIANILSKTHDVDLILSSPVTKLQLGQRLNVDLGKVHTLIESQDNIGLATQSGLRLRLTALAKLMSDFRITRLTRKYDLFIISGVPILSKAKRNILWVDFPSSMERNELYSRYGRLNVAVYDWMRSYLAPSQFDCYDRILVNSRFTKEWVARYWDLDADLLYPPVDMLKAKEKKRMVLSVARFGKMKKHKILIEAFKNLHDSGLRNWELHMAGGIHPGAEGSQYFEDIMEKSKGYPIFLHENIPFSNLADLYGHASIFWHAMGYGEDRDRHPEKFEHFGITTPEAMSAGCVPVTFNGGGQPEIVDHGVNGFMWETIDELEEYTVRLMEDEQLRSSMGNEAHKKARQFDRKRFEDKIIGIVEGLQ